MPLYESQVKEEQAGACADWLVWQGVDKWPLKKARDEWDRIRAWNKQYGRDPRELKRLEKQALIQQSSGPTSSKPVSYIWLLPHQGAKGIPESAP